MSNKQASTMYALLVGIDQYAHPGIDDLDGCVNDVDAMEQLLQDKFKVPPTNIKKLTNQQATHQAIKQAFKDHLIDKASKAEEPPAFLFHYSGHGSQAPDETGVEPDGLDETIVPHDSRINDVYDIKDWELGQLIDDLTEPFSEENANVTIILDCCHSGSGTRDLTKPGVLPTRRCEPDRRPQPTTRPPSAQPKSRGVTTDSGWALGTKYVLLAGCRDREEANEYQAPEGQGIRQHGAMTYFLVKALSQMKPGQALTYRELHERVRYQVNSLYDTQMPQCEGDRDRLVFAGLRPAQEPFMNVIEKSAGYIWIDGGVAHGLTEGSQLHVYPPGTRTLAEAGEPLATLNVEEVGAVKSGCVVETGQANLPINARAAIYRLNHGEMQKAVLLDLPEGDTQAAIEALLTAKEMVRYVKLVDDRAAAQFRITMVAEQVGLQDSTGKLLIAPYPPDKPAKLEELGADLAHIVRYQNALNLQNSTPDSDLVGEVGLAIKKLEFDKDSQEPIAVPLEQSEGGETILEVGQKVVVEITNRANIPLFMSVFNFTHDWAVSQLYPRIGGAHERLAPGQTLSLGLSRKKRDQLAPNLPEEVAEAREFVKVIATVDDADFEILQQKSLKSPHHTRSVQTRGAHVSALSALLEQAAGGGVAQSRNLGAPVGTADDEWTTASVDFRMVQPANSPTVSQPLRGGSRTTLPGYALELDAPAGFSGQVSVFTARQSTRAAGGIKADLRPPAGLAPFGDLIEPVSIPSNSTRNVGPAGAVIQIEAGATERAKITAATPLKLTLPTPVADEQGTTIALAYDGSFYYPVGRPAAGADRTLNVEWLPEPAPPEEEAVHTRNLGRTVKLYLFKMAGWEEPSLGLRKARFVQADRLAAAQAEPEEQVYRVAGGEARYRQLQTAELQAGQRVALFVHGFTSETKWMVSGPLTWLEANSIHYDHYLTFDYDTYSTRISANGQKLARALRAAGFGPEDKLHLDVFAHSMGTQVVRSMVEQHGGDQFVDRCFLAGPPNQGTRLADVKRLIPWLGTLLLNQAGPTPPTVIASWALKKVTDDGVGGEDLRPGSDFYQDLNGSDQAARVTYFILAGRHDLSTDYRNLWDRVVKSLVAAGDYTLDTLFGQQHDMVIPLPSMLTVRDGAYPEELLKSEVLPCNHFQYFSSAEGQEKLLAWLKG